MGKGAATAGLSLVKTASMSGASLGSSPDVVAGGMHILTPEKLDGLWAGFQGLAQMASGAVAQLPEVSSGHVAASTVGFAGTLACLHSFGVFKVPTWLVGEEEEDAAQPAHGFNSSIRPCLMAFCISDAITSAGLFSSIGAHLDVPLRTFAVGSLVLSFPTTWFTDSVVRYWNELYKNQATHGGAFAEIIACAASFGWLAFGTHLISTTATAPKAAPLLFWGSFLQCSAAWSILTCAIVCLIVTTVLNLTVQQQK